MPVAPRRLPGLTVVGFETLTLNNSTASGLNSTSKTGSVILFSVETMDARMRDDGTAPQNATGVVFPIAAGPYYYHGDLANVQFERKGTSGTSTIHICAYSQPGD